MDYSKYFWQGEKVRLRPLKVEDAEQAYFDSLDSPARRILQLGIELPTSIDKQKEFHEKYKDCNDVDGKRHHCIDINSCIDYRTGTRAISNVNLKGCGVRFSRNVKTHVSPSERQAVGCCGRRGECRSKRS